MERTTVNIGKSVVIKGELSGSEDLTIEGQVDGKIELRQNVLTIGPNGKINASEKVDIRDNGSVDGDIAAPRVAIAEGAHFRGSIDMQRAGASAKPAEKKEEAKPAVAASQSASSTAGSSGASATTSGATAGASR